MLPPRAHTRWWAKRTKFFFFSEETNISEHLNHSCEIILVLKRKTKHQLLKQPTPQGGNFIQVKPRHCFLSQMKLTLDLKITWSCNLVSMSGLAGRFVLSRSHKEIQDTSVTRGHNILEPASSCYLFCFHPPHFLIRIFIQIFLAFLSSSLHAPPYPPPSPPTLFPCHHH